VRAIVPVLLAALELSHPAWSDGSITQAIASAGGWWIPLHVLLALGYGLLVAVVLWQPPLCWSRPLLVTFCVVNTAYLGVDGLIVARVDPGTAEALWTSSWVAALANAVGATWAAALLACALAFLRAAPGRSVHIGLAATWLAFIAGATFPAAALASRLIALTTGVILVYTRGAAALPFALLVFAAVLRQHVGPEAALVMLLIAAAIALSERSDPAAASPL
jgi:hypothetical protein